MRRIQLFIIALILVSGLACRKLDEEVVTQNSNPKYKRVSWEDEGVSGYALYKYEDKDLVQIDWYGDVHQVLGIAIAKTRIWYDPEDGLISWMEDYDEAGNMLRYFKIPYVNNGVPELVEMENTSLNVEGYFESSYSRNGELLGAFNATYWGNADDHTSPRNNSHVADAIGQKEVLIEKKLNDIDFSNNLYFERYFPNLLVIEDNDPSLWNYYAYSFDSPLDVSDDQDFIYVKMRSKEGVVNTIVTFSDGIRTSNGTNLELRVDDEWNIYTFPANLFYDAYHSSPDWVDETNITELRFSLNSGQSITGAALEIEWVLIGTEDADISLGNVDSQFARNEPQTRFNHLGLKSTTNFSGTNNWIPYNTFLPEVFGYNFHGANIPFEGVITYEYQ